MIGLDVNLWPEHDAVLTDYLRGESRLTVEQFVERG